MNNAHPSVHPPFISCAHLKTLSIMLLAVYFLTGNAAFAQVVKSFQRISSSAGNFGVVLERGDDFGESIDQIGDLDGDGIVDIVVGTRSDDDGGEGMGAAYVLFLNRDGTVRRRQKISSLEGGFTGNLNERDQFGLGVAGLGDVDGDGIPDIAVGAGLADRDVENNSNEGSVFVLFMNADGTVRRHQLITEFVGGFNVDLDPGDQFGSDIEALADFDGDGVPDMAVSADSDDDAEPGANPAGRSRAAFYILFLNSNGTVKRSQKISSIEGNFTGVLNNFDQFGQTVALIGDLDNDGIPDLAVGAEGDDDGGEDFGAVWILFMNADGTVNRHTKISATSGGFSGQLDINDEFGQAVSFLGDINNDGIPDLAVGAEFDDDGADKAGAAYILLLRRNGTVQNTQKISGTSGGFTSIRTNSEFGQAVASLGDLDLDGVADIVVTADAFNDPTTQNGAVFVIFLKGTPSGPINNAPVIGAIANQSVIEGEELIVQVTATDTDGPGPLVLNAINLPAGAMFTDNGGGSGTLRWTPPVGTTINSPFVVTFSATDNAGATNKRDISINVTPAGGPGNQAPQFMPIADQVATEGQELRFNIRATDEDGPAPLVITVSEQQPNRLFTGDEDDDDTIFLDNGSGNAVFFWTPPEGASEDGPVVLTFTATDNAGNGLSDTQQVRITIQPSPSTSGNSAGGSSGGGGGGGSMGFLLLIGLFILRILADRMPRTPKYHSHRP